MKTLNLGVMILVVLFLFAGAAMAQRTGGMMMQGVAVDTEESAAVKIKLEAKREELRVARGNDDTTVGQLNKLREEMNEMQREYRQLTRGGATEAMEMSDGSAAMCQCGMMGGMKKGMMNGDMKHGMMGGMKMGMMHGGMMGGMKKSMMGAGMHQGMMNMGGMKNGMMNMDHSMDDEQHSDMSDEDLFSEEDEGATQN